MSTYLYSRSGLNLESATLQTRLDRGDLVTFLGVAQRLNIDFLPITWQPALDRIGQGATAEIREASANLQFSFALKRPLLKRCFEFEDFETRLLPCLIAEISILGLKSIRKHPNIINLEGICWEVISWEGEHISREALYTSRKGGIVPVLVFEKSKYGDLHHFMMQEAGRSLSLAQKIGICTDIAKAVVEMHYHDIVHGDLKPQNVLVFDNEAGGYIARVADFGYSTQWALPNDLIQMPRSRPWDAPEWHHRGFTPAQAMKMDSYSFGMVVLWLLGYAAIEDPDETFERDLHSASEAADLSRPLAESISKAHKLDLNQFFDTTLTHNETDRCSDFHHLQELLTAKEIAKPDDLFRKADGSRFTRTKSGYDVRVLKHSVDLEMVDFQVVSSMHQFYYLDYRVRIHLANALLRKMANLEGGQQDNPELQNMFLQCAVCYEIGFGVVRDPCKSQELIRNCNVCDRENFTLELGFVKDNRYNWGSLSRDSTNFRKMFLARTGNDAPKYSLALSYLRQGNTEDIELQYRKEILDVENSLGANHLFVFALKKDLKRLLTKRGQQSEADDIRAQINMKFSQFDPSLPLGSSTNLTAILSLSKKAGRAREAEELCQEALAKASELIGVNKLVAVGALSALSKIAADQGRWKEAEDLSVKAMETSAKELGQTHPDVLSLARDLACIYAEQEKWEEAESLVARSIETSIKILGEEHPFSITSMAYRVRVWTLQQQRRSQYRRQWKTIESLQIEVMKKHIKVYGRDHPNTICSMNNMAMIWSEQRLWRIAKTLLGHVVKASEEVFGEEHLSTLENMADMAGVYQQEMICKNSLAAIIGKRQTCDGKLHRKILELSAKILGWDDPLTLNGAHWLAWILADQKQFKEAEVLQVRVRDTRVRLQGEKHPDALRSMIYLAVTIRKQGRLREAIKLMDKGLHGKSLFGRLYWRLQLSLGLFR